MTVREVKESPIKQGSAEKIAYQFEYFAWGTPTSPVVTLVESVTGVSASSLMSGSPVLVGTKVTTPVITGMTVDKSYKLTSQVDIDSNTLSAYCTIIGE